MRKANIYKVATVRMAANNFHSTLSVTKFWHKSSHLILKKKQVKCTRYYMVFTSVKQSHRGKQLCQSHSLNIQART